MVQALDAYADLFDLIRRRSQHDAVDIVRRLQAGDSLDEAARYLQTDNRGYSALGPRRLALDAFLVNLARSSASLRQTVRLANHTLDPATQVDILDA